MESKDILMLGDKILTENKKDPNHITRQLNYGEVISYNTGFHKGFQQGYENAEESFRTRVLAELEGMKIMTYNSVNESYYKEINKKINSAIDRITNLK